MHEKPLKNLARSRAAATHAPSDRVLIAELVAALEPVGRLANAILSEAPIEATKWDAWTGCDGTVHAVSLDDLRMVTAALSKAKGAQDG